MGDTKQFKFVGREEEYSVLRRAIDSASGSVGQLVTISGEAGAGKTRLAFEASEYAESLGHRVVVGRCREISGAPAYWPWSQILRQISEQTGLPVPDKFTTFAEDASSESAGGSVAETAAFLAHESVSQYIVEAATKTPLLLWFEDVHWADTSSLSALEFLVADVRDRPITLVVTQRSPESTSDEVLSTLGEIARVPYRRAIELQPLAEYAVRELVLQAAPELAESGIVEQVLEITGGNALYVTELTHLMAETSYSEIDGPVQDLGAPTTVVQILARRLSSLPESTITLLESAAVLGRVVDLAEIGDLVGKSASIVTRELGPALAGGIVTKTGNGRARHEFSHELIRLAVLERLDESRLAELNLGAAKLREQVSEENLPAIAGTLAHHYEMATSLVGHEAAVEYQILAGEYAVSRLSYAEARIHLEKAIDRLLPGALGTIAAFNDLTSVEVPSSPLGDIKLDEQSALCLRIYGRSLNGTNEDYLASIVNKKSFDYLVGQERFEEAIQIAVRPLSEWSAASRDMYRVALEITSPGTAERAQICSKWGTQLASFPDPDFEGGMIFLRRAVEEAEQLSDRALLAWCYGRLAMVQSWFVKREDAAKNAVKAASLADDIDDLECQVHAYMWSSIALTTVGQNELATAYADKTLAAATRSRNGLRLWQGRSAQAMVNLNRGRLDEVISSFRVFSGEPLVNYGRLQAIAALSYRGSAEAARSVFNSFRKRPGTSGPIWRSNPNFGAAIARILVDCGMQIVPEDELKDMVNSDSWACQLPFQAINRWIGKGYYGICSDDQMLVQQAYDHLLPHRGTFSSDVWAFPANIDRMLAKFAHYLGRSSAAADHFEDALSSVRSGESDFELGWTCYDYALLLEDKSDHGNAGVLIEEGLVVSEKYGLDLLTTKLLGLADIVAASASDIRPFGLTRRELEVLGLLASGQTNQQIATSLFVSLNTVGTHVKNIYSKTGCSNRAEATRLATERGLVAGTV